LQASWTLSTRLRVQSSTRAGSRTFHGHRRPDLRISTLGGAGRQDVTSTWC
jgi:hypothetical protein